MDVLYHLMIEVGGEGDDQSVAKEGNGGNDTKTSEVPPAATIMDDGEIRRLKDKRDRNRKAAMEEFIPLNGQGDDADHPINARAIARMGLSAEELEAKMGENKVGG